MINNIFYYILNMSIIAAIIVVILLLIRAVFGKWLQKPLIYALWGIVLFRLLIPISISSEYSLINLVNPDFAKAVVVSDTNNGVTDITYSTTNVMQLAEEYNPIEYKTNKIETIFNIFGLVWLIGAVLFVLVAIIIYRITMKRLNEAIKLEYDTRILEKCMKRLNVNSEIGVYESGFINTPIVSGILKTKIIIPKNIKSDFLEYILIHELSHIKRKDNIWKLLTILAVCIHWFNPFAWLFLWVSEHDMENACDYKVLKNIPDDKRKNYALALVVLADNQRLLFPALGNTAVKQRLINITTYKRISTTMLIITFILCIIVTILLITNPIT
ncbi:M56 family metallopeptidase [Vallitalea sp.]|uniref:M56 family metallopeptidase n=1 Tax=Vallitalea sp. TaxID=1882829 RepID=UPI0025FB4D75|nr:M56 family metallopeptidase [Vallitalea sp.]MCT4686018.1 M56 family metallopeptidase [Vallitalea sp.]